MAIRLVATRHGLREFAASAIRSVATLAVLAVVAAGCSRPATESAVATAADSAHSSDADTHSAAANDPPPSGPGKIESVPFAPRPAAAGEHLFELMDPKAIGLDFFHAWTKRPGQLRNNTTGCGVAMGDYDGDGDVDVFLPRSTDGGRLYRNLGNFRFEDVSDQAGILSPPNRWTTGATFVDIDNDGDLDLYVCAFDCPNHLYLNEGDGTFVERAKDFGLDYVGSSAMSAFADYDRDGDLDLYLMTNHIPPDKEIEYSLVYDRHGVPSVPQEYRQFHDSLRLPTGDYGIIESGQYDHFYRNDGQGKFQDVTEEVGIDGNHKGLGVSWWDYNDDGWPDVYVANDFYGPDRLYRNNRDGTFTDTANDALPHTPWFSMGCDFGDLNNDGLLDLIGTDMSSSSHARAAVTMGDIQEEGWFLEMPNPRQYMRNAAYLGSGCERVNEIAYLIGLDSTDWTWSVRFVDLDQDGKTDLHVTNGMSRDWGNSDLKAAGHKLGPPNSEIYNDYWDRQQPLKERNFAFRNRGDLHFENVSQQWGLDQLGVGFGAAFGDLDGDGDLDLVINNFQDMVTVARNTGNSGNAIRVRLVGDASNRWGVDATVNIRSGGEQQAGYLTLARGFMSASDPTLHFGLGAADRVDELTVEWPSGHRQKFTDLAANHFYTITEPVGPPPSELLPSKQPSRKQSPDSKTAAPPATQFAPAHSMKIAKHVEKPFDDFAREPLMPQRLSQQGPGLALGDVNADGRDDLYLGGAEGAWGTMLLNQGDGKWAAPDELFPPWSDDANSCEALGTLLLDVDADGDNDLLIVSGGVETEPDHTSLRDQLYLNDGAGNFARAPLDQLPDLRDSGSIAAAADYDRDGDLDLYIGSRTIPGEFPKTPASRLLKNDNHKFIDATDSDAPELLHSGMVTGALWSDVNDDGWIDLLVTHDWGPIRLFLNDAGHLRDATADSGLEKHLGWWTGISGRDVDGDGDVDYIATNIGRNSAYRPSAEQPSRLFYGDFNQDGKPLVVEGKFDERGKLVPTRSKPEMQRALPFVEAAYPTFAEFAAATLGEILGEQEMNDALQASANFVDSVLLRNDGSGHFTIESLPLMAQISAGFGTALGDFNGDGFTDAYIVQNSYAPRREMGRLDGGMSVLLQGDKHGHFTAVPPAASGLIVPGDAKSLVATDVNEDRWPDFIVGVNNAPVMVFENQHPAQNEIATVKLVGPPGNPTAVGARVTLRTAGGWSQTAEVTAGGGYLSQQPATLVFGLGPATDGDAPKIESIEVRWPDGTRTRRTPAADERDFEIKPASATKKPAT